MPVNFPVTEIKPMNCLSTLTTIPEAISTEPSCTNLHDLSKGNSVEQEQSWCIYENDEENSKSTDALLDEHERDGTKDPVNFPPSISFSMIKENQYKSNCSLSRTSLEAAAERPTIVRSRSNSKNASKIYEPISSESLTDSQGYMDDFDESCALITTNENSSIKKRILSSNDLIMKRNSLVVNKAPQSHRFSAGDADKLEKGIKALPSTRSLRDSWILHSSGTNDTVINEANCVALRLTIFKAYQRNLPTVSKFSIFKTSNLYQF